jgi:hypothetical protein
VSAVRVLIESAARSIQRGATTDTVIGVFKPWVRELAGDRAIDELCVAIAAAIKQRGKCYKHRDQILLAGWDFLPDLQFPRTLARQAKKLPPLRHWNARAGHQCALWLEYSVFTVADSVPAEVDDERLFGAFDRQRRRLDLRVVPPQIVQRAKYFPRRHEIQVEMAGQGKTLILSVDRKPRVIVNGACETSRVPVGRRRQGRGKVR